MLTSDNLDLYDETTALKEEYFVMHMISLPVRSVG